MCSLITLFHELTGRAMSLLPVATVDAPGVADLFAGIGNVLWGFAKAGFRVRVTNLLAYILMYPRVASAHTCSTCVYLNVSACPPLR